MKKKSEKKKPYRKNENSNSKQKGSVQKKNTTSNKTKNSRPNSRPNSNQTPISAQKPPQKSAAKAKPIPKPKLKTKPKPKQEKISENKNFDKEEFIIYDTTSPIEDIFQPKKEESKETKEAKKTFGQETSEIEIIKNFQKKVNEKIEEEINEEINEEEFDEKAEEKIDEKNEEETSEETNEEINQQNENNAYWYVYQNRKSSRPQTFDKQNSTLSTAALIFGILSVVMWFIPGLGFLLGSAGIVLAILSVRKCSKTHMPVMPKTKIGIACSALGIIINTIVVIVFSMIITSFFDFAYELIYKI